MLGSRVRDDRPFRAESQVLRAAGPADAGRSYWRMRSRLWHGLQDRRRCYVGAALLIGSCWLISPPVSVASPTTTTATAPPICSTSFDPAMVSQATLTECGITLVPRGPATVLPSGATRYSYDVDGQTAIYTQPPAGFDPATATSAQLADYGYPPRTSTDALVDSGPAVGPAPAEIFVYQGHQTSTPAAGSLPPHDTGWDGNYTTPNGTQYDNTFMEWNQPADSKSECSGAADSIWTGLGGLNNNALEQAGSWQGAGEPNNGMWWEVVGYNNQNYYNIVFPGYYTSPGALTYSDVYWNASTNSTEFFLWSSYMGWPSVWSFPASLETPNFGDAAFIVEDPLDTLVPLENFGWVNIQEAQATTFGGTTGWLNAFPTSQTNAADGPGGDNLLADSTAAGSYGSDGGFSAYFVKCQ